ncbi:MAG: hypothetical protein JNL60_03025 [Bacteroidia bacterium]|nr:hypothetical protein [Bacteroidia bacterium]
MKRVSLFLVLLSFVSSCVKDKPLSPSQEVHLSNAKKVYVVNEGNYGSGNASVSLFDPGTGEVVEDYFKSRNNTYVGDVAQSLCRINGNYYLVVNNSKKILVCKEDFSKAGQINGLNSPRYILQISNQKAYVSDLYANGVSVINLNTNTKSGSIPCKGKTERMLMLYNKVFVTNTESPYLYVINSVKDAVEDSIYVGTWASSIVSDKNDKVWVLSGGESPHSVGRLSRVDPINNKVEAFFDFKMGDFPSNLCINKTRDSLYYLNSGICRFLVDDLNLPDKALIEGGTKNFYGLDINPNDYRIYAADALLFTERSNIYVFDVFGKQKNLFKAGINSNGFYFE